MPFININTDDMMIPALIPRTAEPAVTGWNSTWLIAGAAALSWILFGSKVTNKVKKALSSKKVKIGK